MNAAAQTDTRLTADNAVASAMNFDEYLENYAHNFYELEAGSLVNMSPIHEDHDQLSRYLAHLFDAYFELRPIGKIRQAPFVMKISDQAGREPDLQIILNANTSNLTPTYMGSAADIVIEIVSPESVARDHGQKFEEYEKAGVQEYWILDPIRKEARFYHLNEDGVYVRQETDNQGYYRTALLPSLTLHVPTLWQEKLPGPSVIVRSVEEMLKA